MDIQLELPSCFHRDLAEGLQQQMFFWGLDVTLPTGNFLKEQGFQRTPSTGLKGTSCYRLPWRSGHIELYGACAGWYGGDGGFTFLRPERRCYVWTTGSETPIPGDVQKEFLSPVKGQQLYRAALPFIEWLVSYEKSVRLRFGEVHRLESFRRYRKVPKAKQWVEPQAALEWFKSLCDSPQQVRRPHQLVGASS